MKIYDLYTYFELMLLNCGVGEDSWESLGLQGDPTSPSKRRSVLNIHWKDWCWSWNSSTLATSCEELTHGKDPDAGRDWGQEEKGKTEDEMAGWHHRLNGHEFGWTLGVDDGQGGLVCCDSWGRKELDTTERLNWTELNWYFREYFKDAWFSLRYLGLQKFVLKLKTSESEIVSLYEQTL